MKFPLLIIALASCFHLSGQVMKIQYPGIDSIVAKIQSHSDSYLKSEKYRDSTGTRCAFVKDGQLMFTRAEVTEQNIIKKVEWYFDKGQIVYCQQTWRQLPGKQILNNEKLYLKDGKLLAWITTEGRPIDMQSKAFKETEFYLVDYSKKLIQEALGN